MSNDRYDSLHFEAAAYVRANAAEARVKDLEAEIEMQRRDQTEFIGAALCALGVNRDESVAPGNQMLAEIERLRGLLKDAEGAIRKLAWRECPDCNGTGALGRASDGRKVSCESCYGSDDRLGDGWLPVGENIEETMCSPAVRRALGEIGGEG